METIDFHNAHLRPHSHSKPIIADLIHRDTFRFKISSYQHSSKKYSLCNITAIFFNVFKINDIYDTTHAFTKS